MPVEADVIYRTREQIAADFMARLQARIPDIFTDEDGNVSIFSEVVGEVLEGIYLANQIVRDNIFIQSANLAELRRHGEQFGLDIKAGNFATGTLRFGGAGGTFIPTGTQAAYDPGTGDPLFYDTTADATIPNPGSPTAPTLAAGAAGNPPAGTYEYVVTFQTVEGETLPGVESAPLTTGSALQINLTNIPLGGPGTTGRRIYRSRGGSAYQLVTTIANNTATTYTDNTLDAGLGAAPPTASTAERVSVAAQAEETGADYNAAIGTVLDVADAPDGVTDVYNVAAFAGGTDEEDMDAYRDRLLDFIRNPQTGSKTDLEGWAEEIDGVDTATAFVNDNLGVATNGHATVRIAGPNGAIPSGAVIAAVQAALDLQDIANATIHVATFTQVSTNVTVVVTPATGYVLADVTASVQQAITDYINAVLVGGTVYAAGIIDAVFGLPGVTTVTTTFTDLTATATQKRIPGTIAVT